MKTRLISLLLCVALIFSVGITVLAETDGSSSSPSTEGGGAPTTPPDGTPDPTPGEGEGTGQEPPKVDFKVSIGKVETFKDTEAVVTFKVDTNPGISYLKLNVEYDTENLELSKFDVTGSVFPGITWQSESNHAVASVAANNNATGVAFSLKFKFKEAALPGKMFAVKIKADASTVLDTAEEKIDIKTEDGYIAIVCREHTFGPEEVVQPTCTDAGSTKKVCTVCFKQETSTLAALGHSIESWTEITPSTCAIAGIREGFCKNCQKDIQEQLPLAEHLFGEWETSVYPTLNTLGQLRRICLNCSAEELQNLAKLVTSVTDPSSGSTVLGNDGLCFPGDAVFSAFQTLYENMDKAEQGRITASVSRLVGKQVYSKYTVYFKNPDGSQLIFDGNVTVTIPVSEELQGVVIVGSSGGNITVLNASVKGGLATFTASQISEEFYVLYDKKEESVINAFQNMFTGGGADGSAQGLEGWIVIIIIAFLLLGLSIAMIMIGIKQQKTKQRAAVVTETEAEFKMEEPAQSSKEEAIHEKTDIEDSDEEDYESAVESLVNSWFDISEE